MSIKRSVRTARIAKTAARDRGTFANSMLAALSVQPVIAPIPVRLAAVDAVLLEAAEIARAVMNDMPYKKARLAEVIATLDCEAMKTAAFIADDRAAGMVTEVADQLRVITKTTAMRVTSAVRGARIAVRDGLFTTRR